MRSCMFFSTVESSIWRSTFIIVRLSARPFSGTVGEVAAPPICILPQLPRPNLRPLLFIFTRSISTPYIVYFASFSAMSNLDNHSKDTIRSWGSSSLLMSPTFLEETPKWSANFLHCFHASWCLYSIRHTHCSKLLLLGLIYTCPSFGGLFGLFIVPKFSLFLGVFRRSRKDCFAIASDVPGFWFRPSVIIVFRQKGFQRAASLLSGGLSGVSVFLHFLWGWDYKNRGNKIVG